MPPRASLWIRQDGGASPGSGGTGPGQYAGQGQLSVVTHGFQSTPPRLGASLAAPRLSLLCPPAGTAPAALAAQPWG